MSTAAFQERINRIERESTSGQIIPGQVGEMTNRQIKSIKKPRRDRTRGKTALTALLFGGILGAFAGLFFQNVVGVETLLALDWEAEMARASQDFVRMGTWVVLALGALLLIITLPSHKRFRKLAGGSLAYMSTAIAVNAQDLIALVPAVTN